MMDLVFFKPEKQTQKNHKIRSTLKSLFMRVSRPFLTKKKCKTYQTYIGGEDFGLHRAGNKHVIIVCDVQRRPQRMYCFDERRDVRSATVISVNSVQQKQSQYKDDSVRSRTFAESRFRF